MLKGTKKTTLVKFLDIVQESMFLGTQVAES